MVNNRERLRFHRQLRRLLGLHGLTQHFTAQLLGVSEATMSSWMNGKSTPSLAKAIDIAELFQISTDRLMGAEFSDLLAHELADPDRYDKVGEAHQARPHTAQGRVTDLGSIGGWEEWLADLSEPDPDAKRFKWGWNENDGEVVWEVGGPGDGWPAHADQLMTAWGREPRAGDVLGTAEAHRPTRGSDPAVVSIHSYGGACSCRRFRLVPRGLPQRRNTAALAPSDRSRASRRVGYRIVPDCALFE